MAQTTIIAPLPDDGIVTFQRLRIERAPDASGSPGAYAEIVIQILDPYNENQSFTDTGGALDSWYRYRYADTAGTLFSTYSDDILAGSYTVKSWLKRDIPDADIVDADWDQWKDMAIKEFRQAGLGRPLETPLTIVPTAFNTYYYDIDAAYRRIIRVEVYDTAGYFITETPQWRQWGRKFRLSRPDTTLTYKLWGIGEIRSLSDINDELFPLLYWYMRLKYIDKRLKEREQWRMFLNADKVSDVKTEDLLNLKLRDAKIEYSTRLAAALEYLAIPAE